MRKLLVCGITFTMACSSSSSASDETSGATDASTTDLDTSATTIDTSTYTSTTTSVGSSDTTTDPPPTDDGAPPDQAPDANPDIAVAYRWPLENPVQFPTGLLLDNDVDPENGPLTVVADRGFSTLANPFAVTEDGTLSFSPTPETIAVWDEIEYVVRDEAGNESMTTCNPVVVAGYDVTHAAEITMSCPRGAVACGIEIAGLGDINGDGVDDLGIAWPEHDEERGRVFVVLGGADIASEIALEDLEAGIGGFVIDGTDSDLSFGTGVAGIGDVNGDGYDDLIVLGRTAHVVHGGPNPMAIDSDDLAAGNGGYRIEPRSQFGHWLQDADRLGDLDGDGRDEFVLGTLALDDNEQRGHAYVVAGRSETTTVMQSDLDDAIGGYSVLDDTEDGLGLGVSVRHLGDVDGDGLADFAAFGAGSGSILGYVAHGRAVFESFAVSELEANIGGIAVYGENFGLVRGVSAVLGPNGIGLAVGSTSWNSAAGHFVEVMDLSTNIDLDVDGVEYRAWVGSTQFQVGRDLLAVGDVNEDGRSDFLVEQATTDLFPGKMRTSMVFGADSGPVDLRDVERGVAGYVYDYPATALGEGEDAYHAGRLVRIDLDGDGQAEYVMSDARVGRVYVVGA